MVDSNKPIKTYKVGALSLSLWENEGIEGTTMKSFTFNRSYKDKEDEWKKTQSLRISDLPKFRILLEEAYKDLVMTNPIEN